MKMLVVGGPNDTEWCEVPVENKVWTLASPVTVRMPEKLSDFENRPISRRSTTYRVMEIRAGGRFSAVLTLEDDAETMEHLLDGYKGR